jgi:acetyl-CoA carboxylase carboxyltransferase component
VADGWGPLLDELERRKAVAQTMGGDERIARQHAAGKLTARERVATLFDPGSFVELGALVGGEDIPADALVAGAGLIDGRAVLAGAEDFTVLGGSIGVGASDKRYRLCQLARERKLPLVMMLDGAGHRATTGSAARRPNDLQGLADLSGLVPMVALVMGASAGHGALTAPLCDFVVMTAGASLFSAGPPLVKAAVGEDVTKEELGGPQVHVDLSGVAHNAVADDAAALALARRYLSYFAAHAWERAPWRDTGDTGRRDIDELLTIIPSDDRRPYPMRDVLTLVFDRDSVLEVQPRFGSSIVTALARLGGASVAVVANDPSMKAGTIDSAAADKAAHFLAVVGAFHLPVVFLADNPGVMAGTKAEREGALRHVARMFTAQRHVQAPKLHVTMRKAFGFGSSVMAMNPFDGQTISLALPGVTLAARPAGERAGEDPEPGPYRAAGALSYDDVIDPRQLRNALLDALRLAGNESSTPVAPVATRGITP